MVMRACMNGLAYPNPEHAVRTRLFAMGQHRGDYSAEVLLVEFKGLPAISAVIQDTMRIFILFISR